jgi:eukaryotic-like serine/threonine-protein kinase
MTGAEWAEVKRLFHAALDLPGPDRLPYVRREAAGNDTVLREVESLLAAEAESTGLLDAGAADYLPVTEIGRRIGPYQIVDEIGAGGMGAVYLAERTGEFRQRVALKLIRPGMDSGMFVSRFHRERQILAALDHPNIARLLDGGAADDGRPYFVMEHVAGKPLHDWCAQHAVSTEQRLRLFLDVCAAVEYAHRRLVVHRDLKPANILVTDDGTVKLLDFGIAKLLGSETAAETVALTEMGGHLMTPEYASPEQVRGLPVTTATDIYSLGVILFELLAGRLPYAFETRSPAEVERVVATTDPPSPSAVAAQPAMARRLTGDLDVIVLKALEKEPERRYHSVEQFGADIRRHLEGAPILARPQTWRYRSGRFIRRNRIAVAAAVLVALSLTGGLAAALWQAHIARQQRARAERNFDDVRHLAQSFLFDFHDRIKDLPGSTDARNMVIQTAVDYLRRLAQEARGYQGLSRDLAEAWLRLGDVQGNPYGGNRGDAAGAIGSYKEALAIADGLVRRDPSDGTARVYLARAHRSIGEILPQEGDVAGAVPHFRAGIAAVESVPDADARIELARCYEMLGDVLGHGGIANLSDSAGARGVYEQALAIHRQSGAKRGTAVLLMKLGDLEVDSAAAEPALAHYQEAAGIFESLPGRREIGMIHRKIGGAYEALGRDGDAMREYGRSAENGRSMMAADPNNSQARIDYTVNLKTRADLLAKRKQYAEALPLYREALAILAPMSAAQPGNLMLRGRYTDMLLYVGDLLAKLREPAEARRLYTEGLRYSKQLADRAGSTPDDWKDYANYLIDCPIPGLADPAEAAAYARRAIDGMPPGSPERTELEHRLDTFQKNLDPDSGRASRIRREGTSK